MYESIFEPGVQVGNPNRNRRNGFGLGLATVRSLLEHAIRDHGISLRSIVGRGTHFMVDVPLAFGVGSDAANSEEICQTIQAINLNGALVAVVEDDESLLLVLVEVLKSAGAFVIEAGSLEQMIARIDDSTRFPDVMLTAYRLAHNVAGRRVIECVRASCGRRMIPALVLTDDRTAAEEEVRDIEAVEVISKSQSPGALLLRLAAHFTSAPSPLEDLISPYDSRNATPARAIS